MNDEFPYSMVDVLQMCGMPTNRTELRVKCPFCNSTGKNLGINTSNGKFHCFSCGISDRGPTKFYAYYRNITTKEAHADIMDYLNLDTKDITDRPERIIYSQEPVINADIADESVRNNTYMYLLSILNLNEVDKNELLSRGFELTDILELGYKTYPYAGETDFCNDYMEIPKKLRVMGCTVEGVPGFYLSKKGNWMLCKKPHGIIMQCKGFNNNIKSLQIRLRNEYITEEDDGKCRWFSTPNSNMGCKMEGNIHYAMDFEWLRDEKCFKPILKDGSIAFTEGYMKADLLHLFTGRQVMAVPGVEVLNELPRELEKCKERGFTKIYDCYDMDYLTNPNVQRGLVKMKDIVKEAGLEYERINWDIKTEDGLPVLKGIDDLYAYKLKGIVPHIKATS